MNNSKNKENDQFLSTIKSTIGKDIIETNVFFNDFQIIVPSKKIFDVLTKLHGNSYFAFDQLIDITAIDYPEKLTRFEVVYLLLSTCLLYTSPSPRD